MTLSNRLQRASQLLRPITNRAVYARRRARLATLEGRNLAKRAAARLTGRPVPPKRNFREKHLVPRPYTEYGVRNGRMVPIRQGVNWEDPNFILNQSPEFKKMKRNQRVRNRQAAAKLYPKRFFFF